MTIEEAFKELTESTDYIATSKVRDSLGNKYRVYLNRFKNGKLKIGAMVEILMANGYEIKANKVVKKK